VAALAVFTNPFAGRFERDLSQLFELGREVGEQVVAEALALLESPAVSYGKAALVGVRGDMEHGGAVIHPKLGASMRAGVGGGAGLIPSNVKVAAVGMAIDIPLGHKDDPWSFDRFDTMTIMVPMRRDPKNRALRRVRRWRPSAFALRTGTDQLV
jgi:hypothetical protein